MYLTAPKRDSTYWATIKWDKDSTSWPALAPTLVLHRKSGEKFQTLPLDSGDVRRTSWHKDESWKTHHCWPKAQLKKSHIHNPPLILILAEHAGLMLLPGEHGTSQPRLDSDPQSSSSCPTSSEPPQKKNLHPSLFTHTFSWKPNKISRLLAAVPTFSHLDLHWESKISSMVEPRITQ